MFKWIFILSFCFYSSAIDNSPSKKTPLAQGEQPKPSSTSFIQFLPPELSSIQINKNSIEDLIKAVGEPLEIRKYEKNKNFFYNLSGINYDTSIGIQNEKISYILYSPPANKNLFLKNLRPYILQHTLKRAYLQKLEAGVSHSTGRTVNIMLEDESLMIVVYTNTKKSIKSLLFLK